MRRIIWLYGKPGSGKTTLSVAIRAALTTRGRAACLLDSDHMRLGPNIDLGFDEDDREENIRRLSYMALLLDTPPYDPWVIVSAVTPRAAHRAVARDLCDPLLVYVKGFDKKMWLGTRFEECVSSGEVVLDTDLLRPDHCATLVVQQLEVGGLL